MKKIVTAFFFSLLFCAYAHSASLYILYDQSCMDRLEYVSLNGEGKGDYIVYHVNTSPGVKVVLEVGAESTTPQDFSPAQIIKCNNAIFDEKLVNAINSNIERVFMVVKKGNNRYYISPITFAARFLQANDYILYDSPEYRFQFDMQMGTIGENIAYKNPNAVVHFEGMLENECSGTLLFLQKAEFAGNSHTNIELIPEVGISEVRSGINAADAMKNILRLERVNGKKLDRYLRQLCKGIDEPDEEEVIVDNNSLTNQPTIIGQQNTPPVTTNKGVTPSAAETFIATTSSKPAKEFHNVKKGETLFRISKQYQVSVDQLKAWNNKGNSNTIYVGENLRVAPAGGSQPTQPTRSQNPQEMPKPASVGSLQPPSNTFGSRGMGGGNGSSNRNYHMVKPGETVASIALNYGYTEKRFREFNGLNNNEVAKIGQALKTSDCECPQPNPVSSTTKEPEVISAGRLRPSEFSSSQGRIIQQNNNSPSGVIQSRGNDSYNSQNSNTGRAYTPKEYNYLNTPLFLDRPSTPPPAAAPAPTTNRNRQAAAAPTQRREYSSQGDFYSITGQRTESSTNSETPQFNNRGIISSNLSGRQPSSNGFQEYNTTGSRRIQAASRDFYVVQEGDTLFSIARRYSMTVEQLRAINDLGANEVIIPYQKIYLN